MTDPNFLPAYPYVRPLDPTDDSWLPSDDEACELLLAEIRARVVTAWETVTSAAARERQADPALHRLAQGIGLHWIVMTDPGNALLELQVASRGIHDLLHAATGERFVAEVSAGAGMGLRVAERGLCVDRHRQTRGITCRQQEAAG